MPAKKQPIVPHASSSLSLVFSFDLSAVPDWETLRAKDHQAAADAANVIAKLVPAGSVVCRSIAVEGTVNLAAVRALPIDDWHAPNSSTRLVRMEFLYSSTKPQLAVRVLTHLPVIDGVSASRLALHTLEAVEGTAIMGASEPFKKNPPFHYGLRQRRNFAGLVGGIIAADIAGSCFCQAPLTDEDVKAPSNYRAMKAYYAQGGGEPALFRTYVPANKNAAYKAFIMASDTWNEKSKMKGLFNLINLAAYGQGEVAASIVPKAADLLDIKKR